MGIKVPTSEPSAAAFIAGQQLPAVPPTSVEGTPPATSGESPIRPAQSLAKPAAPSAAHKSGCRNDCEGCRVLFDNKDTVESERIKRQGAAQHAVAAVYGSPVVAQAVVTKNEADGRAYIQAEVRAVYKLLLDMIEGR